METNFIIHFTATQKNQENSPLTTKNVRFTNEVKAPLLTTRSTKKTLSTQISPIRVPKNPSPSAFALANPI